MEKRMRNFNWAAAVFLLSLLLVVGLGCDNKTGSGGGVVGDQVGSVTLSIGTDTLRFLPGDSASTTITIIVSDLSGRVMEDVPTILALSNHQLGFIEFLDTELRDTTNAQGRVNVLFTAIGTAGDNIFTATAGSESSSQLLAIRPQNILVGSLSLSVTPSEMFAAPGVEDSAQVCITIKDDQNLAIEGLSVNVSATGGRIVPLPPTDAAGRACAWWYNNDEFGEFEIRASAGTFERTATVNVLELPPVQGTLTVTTDVHTIRADGCVTRANIVASLRDRFGSAVVDDTIRFGTGGIGSIQPLAITDSLGIASLEFCEYNVPNDPGTTDSAYVTARYVPWGLVDTIRVWVDQQEDIDFVTISVSGTQGTAGIDSISINLTARYVSGAPVNGLYAQFSRTPCGEFSADSMRLVGGSLDDAVFYKMCQTIPTAADEPYVIATVAGVESNVLIFDPQPGPASRIVIDNPPITAFVNVPVTLFAAVLDTFMNFVEDGQQVLWTTNLGSITPVAATIGGLAESSFNPGTAAGPALIHVSAGLAVDSSIINVQAGDPNSINLTVSEPSLEVAGTGGVEWTQLQATVLDPNGNPVPDGTWVTFRILQSPGGGININDHGLVDSSQTANGMAVATLNSGIVPGPVYISACTYDFEAQADICVQHGGITIVAGPPADIFIYPTEIAEDGGGAAWDLELSALVVDLQQNPVRCGVAVFFDVIPSSTAEILSRNVITCNWDMQGDSAEGIAYTILRYLSPQTFNTIQINAATANGTSTNIEFILPLQDGFLDLYCNPSSWHFVAQGNPCRIECIASVQDGHDVAINGATVYFASQRGRLYDNPNGVPPTRSFAFSGPLGGSPNGQAILWLVEEEDFIFPDGITPEIAGEVRAEVVGYSAATAAQVINFRR